MAGTTTFHGNVQPMYTEQNPSWLEKEFIFHDEEDQHQHTPTKRIEDGNSKKIALSNNIVFDVSENEHHKQPSSSVSLASSHSYEEILPHENSVLPFQTAFDNMLDIKDRMASLHAELPNLCGFEHPVDCLDDEDMLVNIKVKSSTWDFNSTSKDFSLPIQVIVSREKEMHQIANCRGESWKESFIMKKVKRCLSKLQTSRLRRDKSMVEDWYSFNHQISVVLDIDEVSNPSDTCNWHPYLIDSIRKYYATGEISITEKMLNEGYDVLLAFSCLDIIYDDKLITFDSFATSLRSKTWRTYHQNREKIAKWVERELKGNTSLQQFRRSMAFVTSPMSDGFDIFLADVNIKCAVMNMRTSSEGIYHDVVYSLFNEDHIDSEIEDHTRQLRKNFMTYLENRVHRVSITFLERQVYFQSSDSGDVFSSFLPVLLIDQRFDEPDSKKQDSPKHNYINEILFDHFNRCNGCANNDPDDASAASSNKSCRLNATATLSTEKSCSTRTEHTSKTFDRFGSSLTSLSDLDEYERKPQKMSMPPTPKLDDINAKWLVNIFLGTNV